ncbi:hypothetical protein CP981_20245 [Streptomyces platensis]|uniref:Uncharacterized protein n=1 Tax=Streptomyces platensis TaxID=58346 RepID=A0AAE6TQS6_STRPT|nr:hypothetical protein CP981_20245 [Streptomyces platensis]
MVAVTISLDKPLAEEPEAGTEDTGLKARVEKAEQVAEKAGASVGRLIEAFADGNSELAKQIGPGTWAWCRRGHRGDLDGISADLGVWARVGVLGGAGYGLWRLLEAHPGVMWPLAAGWCVACLKARVAARKKGTEEDGEEAGEETPAEAPAAPSAGAPVEHPVVALVRASIGAEKGVHLKVLLPLMRERLEGCKDARSEALKKVLADHHIPTRPKVRVGKVGGYAGVHRDDMPPLPSPADLPTPHPTGLPTGGDAGQSPIAGSGGERRGVGGEPVGSGGERRQRLVQDPDNPARWHCIPD